MWYYSFVPIPCVCVICLLPSQKKKKKETLDLIWIKKKTLTLTKIIPNIALGQLGIYIFFFCLFFFFSFFSFFLQIRLNALILKAFYGILNSFVFFFFGKLLMHIEQVWVLGLLALLLCFLKFQIYCHLDSWMIGSNLCYVFCFIQVSA